ncbi:MAG: hypothetical protein LUQ41_03180 [Methanomicrobiales archaeon]|nr:hypothetical protein [Methanomicrobiales archaeon]
MSNNVTIINMMLKNSHIYLIFIFLVLVSGCIQRDTSAAGTGLSDLHPSIVTTTPLDTTLESALTPAFNNETVQNTQSPASTSEKPMETGIPQPEPSPVENQRILPFLKTGKADRSTEYSFLFRQKQHTVEPRFSYVTWTDAKRIKLSMRVYDINNKSARIPKFNDFGEYLTELYKEMIFDPAQEATYDSIIEKLRHIRDTHYLDDDEYVELMIASVQRSFHYLEDLEYPKYPVDLVASSQGDCDDKSLLLAGILSREGYGVCLLRRPGHLALGILGDDNEYHYIEATDENGNYIDDEPVASWYWSIYPLTGGKSYTALNEVRYIRNVVKYLRNPSDSPIYSPSYDEFCESVYKYVMDNVDNRHLVYENLKSKYPDIEKYVKE